MGHKGTPKVALVLSDDAGDVGTLGLKVPRTDPLNDCGRFERLWIGRRPPVRTIEVS